jgi:hypothetical protein
MTESKSGREAWSAKTFIDCTGDGDLAARAGCAFDVGRPGSGACQPMSLEALVIGLRADEVADFIGGGSEAPKLRLLAEMERAGVHPSYAKPVLFHIREGLFLLAANHEYGVPATDAEGITAGTIRARAEIHRIVNALRKLGGPWRDVRVVATGEQIGVREGRRVRGRYEVTVDDMVRGATHEDAVCRVTFGIDVHSTDPTRGKSYGNEGVRAKPYDIPIRALIARDADGLLLAGRCISGDFLAHSSYRVTGNAAAMGQAAGALGAVAALSDRLPHEVPWAEVQSLLPGTRG